MGGRPALRIVFAPLFQRDKLVREAGLKLHGQARGRTIWIDPRSKDILDTLVHEMIHIEHPSWTEPEVNAHTKRRLAKASWKEKARLLKLLGHAELEGQETVVT